MTRLRAAWSLPGGILPTHVGSSQALFSTAMLRLLLLSLVEGGEGVETVPNRINSSDLPPRKMLRHPYKRVTVPSTHPGAFLWFEDPLLYHTAGQKRTLIHWEAPLGCFMFAGRAKRPAQCPYPRKQIPLSGGQLRTLYKGTFSIRETDRAVLATAGSCHFRRSVRSGSRKWDHCSYG